MKIINREELKAKLERGDRFKLVLALAPEVYEQMHIPGSLNFKNPVEAAENLDPDEEVIVYCSNPSCPASVRAYLYLRSRGFENLARYAGGLEDWIEAGFPLEGKIATRMVAA